MPQIGSQWREGDLIGGRRVGERDHPPCCGGQVFGEHTISRDSSTGDARSMPSCGTSAPISTRSFSTSKGSFPVQSVVWPEWSRHRHQILARKLLHDLVQVPHQLRMCSRRQVIGMSGWYSPRSLSTSRSRPN